MKPIVKNLGKVSITPRGDYDVTQDYEILDTINFNEETFIARKDVPKGTPVNNEEYWMKIASGPSGTIETIETYSDDNVGTPRVNVVLEGTPQHRIIKLYFKNMKGVKGDKGEPGVSLGDVVLTQDLNLDSTSNNKAISQEAVAKNITTYDLSRNLPARLHKHYSTKWKKINYDNSLEQYQSATTYSIGDKCNMSGDTSNSYEALEEVINIIPYNEVTDNKYTLEEAINAVPTNVKRFNLNIQFIDIDTNKEVVYNYRGGDFINISSWELDVYKKFSELEKELNEFNISSLYPSGGIDGTNRYTLALAISKIPFNNRKLGVKVIFINEIGELVTYKYSWEENGWTQLSFMRIYDIEFNNFINEYYDGEIPIDNYLVEKWHLLDNAVNIEIKKFNKSDVTIYTFTPSIDISSNKLLLELYAYRNNQFEKLFAIEPMSDEEKNKEVTYNKETIYESISIIVNWQKITTIENFNVAIVEGFKIKNIEYVNQSSQYPFLGSTNFNLKRLKGFKDVYITDRDKNKHYFISHCLVSTSHTTYQFRVAKSDTVAETSPNEYEVIMSIDIDKTMVSKQKLKEPYLIEKNGVKLLVILQELIDNEINFEYYGDTKNPYSDASNICLDLEDINNRSFFKDEKKLEDKQDKLISAGENQNIKTINGQDILGKGNINIVGGTNDYPSLTSKPQINNVELNGNLSLKELGILTSDSLATINGKPIDKGGNIDYAANITNNADNVTITSENGELKLKDRFPEKNKLGYITIAKDTILTNTELQKWENCVVEIRAAVTLTGENHYNMPQGLILKFNGGYFNASNFSGKLYPKGAKIIAYPYQIFYDNITIAPHTPPNDKYFVADIGYPEWFGAKGDGTNYDAGAFNLLNKYVNCPIIMLQAHNNYNLEAMIEITDKTLLGNPTTKLIRNRVFIDIPIISDIDSGSTSSSGVVNVRVDSSSPDYAKLKIGMGITIVNTKGLSRDVELAYRVITAIDNDIVTLKGNTLDVQYPANTVSLTNNFNLVKLLGYSNMYNVIIDGSKDIYPKDRVYWENGATIATFRCINTVIKNCRISNSIADGIVVSGQNILLEHNIIKHSGANGIHFSGSYISEVCNNYIFDSNINPLTEHNEGAITYSNHVANIFIHNNTFDNCLSGIGSISSADNCKSIITDNLFINFRTHGIEGFGTNTQFGSITRQFVISNNRFIATNRDVSEWEKEYHFTPEVPIQDATGYAINFTSNSDGYWESISINGNILVDCGVLVKNAQNIMMNNNNIHINHEFEETVPNDIIVCRDSKGIIQDNLIFSKSNQKTNCFVLTNSKVSVRNNAYELINCTLSDSSYPLLIDNVNINSDL